MNWIFLALLNPLIDTCVAFIDTYAIGNRIKNPQVLTLYMAVLGLLAGTGLFFYNGMSLLSNHDAILVILSGVLMFYSNVFYFKALEVEETSIVIMLFQISPVITLIFSWLFLNETITFQQFLGFILIFASSLSVSLQNSESSSRILSNAFWVIMTSNILWSIGAVLLKFSLNTEDYLTVLPYESWGVALGGTIALILSSSLRKDLRDHIANLSMSTLGILTFNEVLGLAGVWVIFLAFSMGPVALVDVIASSQVFFGIFIGWTLTLLAPHIFNEDVTRKGLLLKVVAAGTLFYGMYLMS